MWDSAVVQRLLLSIFGLVIILAGIRLGGKAQKADYAETARVGFNVIVSVVIVAVGAGAIAFAVFGKQILRMFGVSV